MLKTSLLDRCLYGREGSERLHDFNENVPEYLKRAAAGENSYKLEIDQEWANFIHQSSKITLKKLLLILIAIAPSFSKVLSAWSTKFVISGCTKGDSDEALSLSECIRYNGNSVYLQSTIDPQSLGDYFQFRTIFYTTFLLMPHLYFVFAFWSRYSINKYSVWISAAKIHLTTQEKRKLTCRYYLALVGTVISALISSLVIIAITIARTFMGGYSMDTDFTVYFRYEINVPSILLNSLLVYSCLFTVLFSNIREPMLFFTGFRNYLKKASKVGYNTATVNYRIKKDDISWKFIQRYYAEYKNYDGNIVLTAMTTHFLDLGILEIEGSNTMLESTKTERS